MNKENFILLKEAESLFEKFKDEYVNTNKNISMRDCLIRNHEIRRLPLYIKSNDNNYTETRDNLQNISCDIYVNPKDLERFFHKELILFSAADFYGYPTDTYCEDKGQESWTDIFKEWEDSDAPYAHINIEMKYK